MHEFSMDQGKICLEEKTDLAYLYLEITNRCNLACNMCFKQSWNDTEGDMTWDLFEKALRDTTEFPHLKMIYFGGIGEPFVHPQFLDMVREARRQGIRVGISTNGFLLTDEIMREFIELQVDLIYFSMDVIPMMPTKIGHAISTNTVEKLRRFKELKISLGSDLPHLGVESVVTKENYHQIGALADYLTEFDIHALILSNLLPSTAAFSDLIAYDGTVDLSDQLHQVYLTSCEDRGFLLKLPEFTLRTERHCDFVEKKTAIVRWDGEVAPCYRFLHTYPEIIFGRTKQVTAHSFGNLSHTSLKRIWTSREYLWFRYVVQHALYPSCTDCTFMEACAYVQGTEMDCWSNMPSCGDCLWSRKIVLCPIPVESFGKFR